MPSGAFAHDRCGARVPLGQSEFRQGAVPAAQPCLTAQQQLLVGPAPGLVRPDLPGGSFQLVAKPLWTVPICVGNNSRRGEELSLNFASMTASPSSSSESALRDAVDTTLIYMLTSASRDHPPDERARQELFHVIKVLKEHPQLALAVGATHAVRAAAEHLAEDEWAQACTALVVACEKLTRPVSQLGRTSEEVRPVNTAAPRRCAWRRSLDD